MISTAKIKAAVPLAVDVAESLLKDMEARAVEFIGRQAGRYFGASDEITEYLSGSGNRILRLPEPLTTDEAVTLVEERAYPGGTATEIPDDGFQVRPSDTSTILVRTGGNVWTCGMEYAVTYTRGYETDQGPKDIEQLIVDLIALRLTFRGREGLRSESIGDYSYTRFGEGDLDSIDGAWATIGVWRRPAFA